MGERRIKRIMNASRIARFRERWIPAVFVLLTAVCVPGVTWAQLNVLAPTFANLNGAAIWSSAGFTTGAGQGSDRRPQWRWGFAAFYGPFGGQGDTLVTFTQTVSDSADSVRTIAGRAGAGAHTRTTRESRGQTRRMGGGKVMLIVGYQHSSFYRFGTALLPDGVPVGGVFVGSLLGPYPLPGSRRLSWYGGVGGTIVRLASIATRADTLAVDLTSERTLAPEVLGMLMYNIAPSYRVFVGASYQYLRFGSLTYHATQSGDRIPAATLKTLPRSLDLQSVHLSLGFSFTASGLIPGR